MLQKILNYFKATHSNNDDASSKQLPPFFEQGKQYQIVSEFNDFDGTCHKAGTILEYVDYKVYPYDKGLTLLFKRDQQDYVIRLALNSRNVEAIIQQNLTQYIAPIKANPAEVNS
ncbi:hypothetical protein DS2_19051 [Catenovulum agarivorans DS-2]|uniref:Uncharacterized protein n=1 Tax=Catenovulum agarivorans DS-2 TaxID=1328313 RepID=W7Q5Q4_9ALTE|nr:DUF3601 domain-containing protein [Catenovulum agarivorans]EWH08109.1 hypothetical protein DS2_19051 [Catenovulum agarivorans DS-2]